MMVCVFDPFLEQVFIIVMSATVVIMGGVIGLKMVQYKALTPNFVNSKVKQANDLANEYKKDAQHWKGKFGRQFQDLQVEGSYDLTSSSDIGSLAKVVLPNILSLLPPEIANKAKGFLDNPEIIEMGLKLYEKHPEDIKLLLGKFIKGAKGKGTSEKGIGSDVPGLETQDESTFA